MTERIHTNATYASVGMLEVLNEPVHSGDFPDQAADMVNTYYPLAWNRIRDTESKLGVSDDKRLHIQFMVCSSFSVAIENSSWSTYELTY